MRTWPTSPRTNRARSWAWRRLAPTSPATALPVPSASTPKRGGLAARRSADSRMRFTQETNVPSPPPVKTVPYRRATTSSAMALASSALRDTNRCSSGTTEESARLTSALTCFALAFRSTATSAPGPGQRSVGWKRSVLATIRSIRTPQGTVTRMSE